jgi:ABC-type glycerol-3-phosphate transport system substrate-binding protein
VSGGTAPAMFPGNVLGGWGSAATRSAFEQGLAADVTALADTYAFADKLAEYAKPAWANSKVNGKFYAAPQGYSAGNGIYFRRDLVQELGLEEPTPGWTWDDLRTLAKGLTEGRRKGLAIQSWGLGWALNAEAFNLLTQLPAPDTGWNWQWDYTSAAQRWSPLVQSYRDMIYVDQSVLSEVSSTDQEVTQAFSQGRAAIMPNNTYFFTGDPDSDNTPANLAKKMDKDVGDVYGWIQHPRGKTGYFGATTAFMTLLSFSPDLTEEALDKAVNLHDYMTFGPGYVRQKKAAWELGKDLKKVYTEATPLRGMDPIDGVPGSLEDAWGPEFVQAVQEATQLPTLPDQGAYFPAEENPGPEATAMDDAQSKWQFERRQPDIAADLGKAESTRNKQAGSFTSSTPDEEFVAVARKYYAAHRDFWAQHAPEFAETTFQGWYDGTILPALG